MTEDESPEIDCLVASLRQLGSPEAQSPWGRASSTYDHLGAKLADAVLQSGVKYEVFVRPRVNQIASDYPEARTASGFLKLLESEGPVKVLNLKSGRKLRTIVELTQFFVERKVEHVADLKSWLMTGGNPSSMVIVHGVGPKTVSFLKLLVGLDAIAVDVHILRFVKEAGVNLTSPELVEVALTKAGATLGLSGEQVDQLVWRHMAARAK